MGKNLNKHLNFYIVFIILLLDMPLKSSETSPIRDPFTRYKTIMRCWKRFIFAITTQILFTSNFLLFRSPLLLSDSALKFSISRSKSSRGFAITFPHESWEISCRSWLDVGPKNSESTITPCFVLLIKTL